MTTNRRGFFGTCAAALAWLIGCKPTGSALVLTRLRKHRECSSDGGFVVPSRFAGQIENMSKNGGVIYGRRVSVSLSDPPKTIEEVCRLRGVL